MDGDVDRDLVVPAVHVLHGGTDSELICMFLIRSLIATTTPTRREAILVDSIGLTLLVVLETLSPAARLAFVLHEVFAGPFVQLNSAYSLSHVDSVQVTVGQPLCCACSGLS